MSDTSSSPNLLDKDNDDEDPSADVDEEDDDDNDPSAEVEEEEEDDLLMLMKKMNLWMKSM